MRMHAGYPMARNLRAKIPVSDTLVVHDVNEEAMRKLVDEAKAAGGNAQVVEITDSPRALAEKAVRFCPLTRVHTCVRPANSESPY